MAATAALDTTIAVKTPENIAFDYQLAGPFRRLPAYLIDFAVRWAVIIAMAAGLSVVLDYPANTVEQRNWMRGLLQTTTASHKLHVLDVSDEICLARLRARNASGEDLFGGSHHLRVEGGRHRDRDRRQLGLRKR